MNKKQFLITKPGVYKFEETVSRRGEERELRGVLKADQAGDYIIVIESRHVMDNTKCRVEVKGVVSGGARVKIKGTVKIEEVAYGSDSFLAMKLLILDDKSSATAEPELEIKNNEVKASHSASIGRIDDSQRFYLQSRGLSKSEAEKLIVNGFLGEVE